MDFQFKVGDKIRKLKGYAFDGTIVSCFRNTKGENRVVAELDNNGMLHVFSESQLDLREVSSTPAAEVKECNHPHESLYVNWSFQEIDCQKCGAKNI